MIFWKTVGCHCAAPFNETWRACLGSVGAGRAAWQAITPGIAGAYRRALAHRHHAGRRLSWPLRSSRWRVVCFQIRPIPLLTKLTKVGQVSDKRPQGVLTKLT